MSEKEKNVVERETYYITAEQMAKVSTYLPIRAKSEWAGLVADKCISRVEVTASLGGDDVTLPPMYKENFEIKSRYLMGAFVKLYLHGSWEVGEGEDEWLMPIDEYDKWAGGHIFAQVEKFKSDSSLRDSCFNLMNDFKDLTRFLNTEIEGLMNVMNDPTARQMASMQLSMTPEAMERAISELNAAKDALMEIEGTKSEAKEEETDG